MEDVCGELGGCDYAGVVDEDGGAFGYELSGC